MSDGFKEFVAELKAKADIVQVIGEAVPLRRAGRAYKGLCPFHAEKTPSFVVDPVRASFHCFGCGKAGSVFDFVMENEHLPFIEAARRLAGRYGVPVPEIAPRTAEERAMEERKKEIASALAAAQELFEARLYEKSPEGIAARRYLKGRGIDSAIAKPFGLGAAPQDPHELERALAGKGLSATAMKEAGLLHFTARGDAVGAFRGRVTFPIRTASGKLVGFGARTLGADEPKYLNSPESPIFRKGRALYGIFEAVKTLRGGATAILVEGNLDVVSLHKAGFTSAIAPLGTALTPEQAQLLESYTQKVTVMFDGDSAGHRATLRALPILMARRFEVTVATLPQGSDPDAYVRERGHDAIQKVLDEAVNPVTFAIDAFARGLDLREPRFRARIITELRPLLLASGNPVERQSYVQIVADRLKVDERAVMESLRATSGPSVAPRTVPVVGTVPSEPSATMAERQLLVALLRDPSLASELSAVLSPQDFSAPGARMLSAIRDLAARPGGGRAMDRLDDVPEPSVRANLSALLEDPLLEVTTADEARELALRKSSHVVERQRELREQIDLARKSGDRARAAELGQKLLDLGRAKEALPPA
ncbi:MAG: DNA primase [Acidobacteriota bacterium]